MAIFAFIFALVFVTIGLRSFAFCGQLLLGPGPPKATTSPGATAITYAPGDKVTHGGDVNECLATSANETPNDHPAPWKRPTSIDDVRVAERWAEYGVH